MNQKPENSMIRSNNIWELLYKLDKKNKKESRENELWALKHKDSFPDPSLFQEYIELEKSDRERLDKQMKFHRQKMIESK